MKFLFNIISIILFSLLVSCSLQYDTKSWVKKNKMAQYDKSQIELDANKILNIRLYDYNMNESIKLDAFNISRVRLADVPDIERSLEILEKYDLKDLRYLGIIKYGDKISGLVAVDNLIYKLDVGNHLGKNRGIIKRIDHDKILIEGIVENNQGTWVKKDYLLRRE